MDEPETLKDLSFEIGTETTITENVQNQLRQLIIKWIKYMQREGRDGYFASIDRKSAIPTLQKIFNLEEKDNLKKTYENFL